MKRLLFAMALALLITSGLVRADPQASPAPAQVMVMLHLPPPHFRADANYSGNYRNDGGHAARRRLALDLAQKHGLTLVSDWPMPVLGVDCYVMALPTEADPDKVASLLTLDPRVEWAQPVTRFHALGQGDPLYPVQPAAALWHLSELHRAATGRRALIAVIDSGIDASHPELAGQVALQENFIDGAPFAPEAHGTAVAGIIVAHEDNGIGIRGVAPGARLLALRACRETGGGAPQCDSFSLAKALNFAILRAPRVINLSLTGPADRILQRLIDAAQARGILVVGAADPQQADGGFPAAWHGVFGVSAGGGPAPVLGAPGRDIPTTAPGGRFAVLSGASFAAAHVSGLLALLGELRPDASAADLRAGLLGPIHKASNAGGAMIDACAALARVSRDCVCTCSAGGAGITAATAP